MENREPDDLLALITDDDVIVRQFTIRRMTRLLEIDVQNIDLGVV